jgi:hypothetical protein
LRVWRSTSFAQAASSPPRQLGRRSASVVIKITWRTTSPLPLQGTSPGWAEFTEVIAKTGVETAGLTLGGAL